MGYVRRPLCVGVIQIKICIREPRRDPTCAFNAGCVLPYARLAGTTARVRPTDAMKERSKVPFPDGCLVAAKARVHTRLRPQFVWTPRLHRFAFPGDKACPG